MQMGSLCIHSSALSCIPAATLKQGLSLLPRLKISAQRCERGCRAPSLKRTLLGHQYCHTDVPIGPSRCHSPHRASSAPDGLTNFADQGASEPPHKKRADPNFNRRAMPAHSIKDTISNECYHCTPVCPSTPRFNASSPAGPCRKRGAIFFCASCAGYPTRLFLQILRPIKVYRMRGLGRMFGGIVAAQCRLG
jgi:hypothetical protein